MIKVSIIVPIYGVEKYLRQCVDSILAQTLKEIEVILVDDGSPDACPQIVDEYAARDARVVAVHQENGGYGRAVNHGIELARGTYIGIVESDDWIEPTMYEKLYVNACTNDSDLVKAKFYIYNSKRLPTDKLYDSERQTLDTAPNGAFTLEEWPELLKYHASIWSNLYRSEFVKAIKILETKSASYQDFPFMCECYSRAQKISIVKEPLVHYRMEEGQSSSTIRRDERLLMMPEQCSNGKEILKRYGKFDVVKDEYHYHSFLACIGFYRNIFWKHKRKYMKLFAEALASVENPSKNKYFSLREASIVRHLLAGHLLRSLYTFREIRRMFFSFSLTRKGMSISLLGIRIMHGECGVRPAIIQIKL